MGGAAPCVDSARIVVGQSRAHIGRETAIEMLSGFDRPQHIDVSFVSPHCRTARQLRCLPVAA